jgi:6-phosphofructokinase 2
MPAVITLTPNPALDLSTSINRIVPTLKLRCGKQRRDPGGGGLNVARVIKRFGGNVEAIFPVGGFTGQLLHRLMEEEGIISRVVEAEAETREDFFVSELSTDSQYRFIMPGQPLRELEWRKCVSELAATDPPPKFIIGSGSLPAGVPNDFYAQAAVIAREIGAKFFLDTAGAPLSAAIECGVYLIKPNLSEMSELAGVELSDQQDWMRAAREIIQNGKVEVVALSLGHLGAMVVTHNEAFSALGLPIKPVSAVGAGDSFLGALVFSMAAGASLLDSFRLAVGAGAAALMNSGTELCRVADAYRLSQQAIIERV